MGLGVKLVCTYFYTCI